MDVPFVVVRSNVGDGLQTVPIGPVAAFYDRTLTLEVWKGFRPRMAVGLTLEHAAPGR
jgi:hypothetical protein